MGKKQTFESYSSNINEVIKTVLNFFFFYKKISQVQQTKDKAQNHLQRTKIKNAHKKHLSSNINEVIKTI